MAKTATPKIGLRSSERRTLRFGLVNVGISMAPALDEATRVSGKMLDPDTLTPLKQQYVNDQGDVVPRDKIAKGYAYGEGYVVLEPDEVPKLDSEGVIDLTANIAASDVPSEWVDKTYLAWPTDTTQDAGYALVSHYLRSYGRAFIGTTVSHGTTKCLALRWSDTYGAVVAQLLNYEQQVRRANIATLHEGLAAIPEPTDEMAAMARTIFEGVDDDFAWDEVVDEYGVALEAAIREKGENGTVTAATPTARTEATDLMAALIASQPKGKVTA